MSPETPPAAEGQSRALADAGRDPLLETQQVYVTLLFNKYRGALHRHLASMVASQEDAADLVQDSYFRLVRHGNLMQIDAMARAFLFETATNLARDHLRRRRTRPPSEPLDEFEPPGDAPSPERQFALAETLAAIREAIVRLPPICRDVFLLSRFRDRTYVQIAEELGISTRSVDRHMASAMAELERVVGARL
ncbi:MAG: RNA polymerase sigma factor [Steroidobacterales bacterium]